MHAVATGFREFDGDLEVVLGEEATDAATHDPLGRDDLRVPAVFGQNALVQRGQRRTLKPQLP
ncbi:hypothetical protein [Microterricola gilva]|uniref:hypothetical protein n=1 Tax=Microterricola gilva TaxID=393267 RepID=UPI00102C17EB|nr:hypothetical protein [Microterricola gilva]